MSDHDDLIAAARERAQSDSPTHTLISELADALESALARTESLHSEWKEAYRRRDAALAEVERITKNRDEWASRMMELASAEQKVAEQQAMIAVACNILHEGRHAGVARRVLAILSTSGTEALEAVKADAWWRGVTDQWTHRPLGNRIPEFSNPYRKSREQSNG